MNRNGFALLAGLGLITTGILTAAELPKEWPKGPYDGPVKTVYTRDNAPTTPKPEALEQTDTITQYGITWKLDRKVRVGRFITGDWYFLGPATVTMISPKPLFGEEVSQSPDWKIINQNGVKEQEKYAGKWARHGSVLNQRTDTQFGGYDSRICHGHYDPAQFTPLPIAMKPGDALISTISTPDLINYAGYGQPVLVAAVLTCLAEPVPADAFRPSYCDRTQKIYLARNLHRELLYTLPRPKSAPASLGEWARGFQRPWLDTVSWGYAGPKDNMPRYGQWITDAVSKATLLLQLDYEPAEKEPLLVHYVQYGVDLWGIARAGYKGWCGHGGFGGGRKWSLVFAGLLLGDDEMREPNRKFPDLLFGEDTQTASGKSWSGFDVVFTSHPAWTDAKTKSPELEPPSRWKQIRDQDKNRNGFQSEGYRRCCTSIEWPGQALAAHLMRAEKYWNHDPFFTYVDRWMEGEDLHATAKTVIEADGKTDGWYLRQERTNSFFQEMWTKYRHSLPAAKAAGTTMQAKRE